MTDRFYFHFHFSHLCIVVGMVGCAHAPEPAPAPTPEPLTVFALTYAPGPNWDVNLPVADQDLAGHFAHVAQHFDDGSLLANGLLPGLGHGLYLFQVEDGAAVDAFVAADPGVQNDVLMRHSVEPWSLLMEDLDSATGPEFFVLDYLPGERWEAGKPLFEQDIDGHVMHVGTLFEQGRLLAGGPMGTEAGRYIVSADSRDDAEALVNDDPGVQAEIFFVRIEPWEPVQRQSVRTN